MRRSLLLFPLVIVAAACGDGDGFGGGFDGNEIVFGIEQRAASGKDTKEISAGYDYLQLTGKGGWTPYVFADGDGRGTCYFEKLDQRLGRPRVDSGVATFAGGRITTPGLQVLANQADRSKQDGPGWDDGDDVLTFSASGFAMPSVTGAQIVAPRIALDITAIAPALADGATDIAIKPTDAVSVAWTAPTTGPVSQVMVVLQTVEDGGPGSQVRCFGRDSSGSAVIPPEWVARLFSAVDPAKPLKGQLVVASHRQLTILSRGHWTVYVVATAIHKEVTWTGTR